MVDLRLTRRQQQLYDLLKRRGDVPFVDLFVMLGGRRDKAVLRDQRGRYYAQGWLSHPIARLNRRLEPFGEKIHPGEKRRTYRLSRIS